MFDIQQWMRDFVSVATDLFGTRLVCVGLQGSYGRGEAGPESDLDVVIVADRMTAPDLLAYRQAIAPLPRRGQICGFLSGRRELANWERAELFQLYYDTTPYWGDLDFLLPLFSREDVRRAVRMGACGVYHACAHNLLHERDAAVLKSLYKSAVFTIQAAYYIRAGAFIRRHAALASLASPAERQILLDSARLRENSALERMEFEALSARLFSWAGDLICAYGAEIEEETR